MQTFTKLVRRRAGRGWQAQVCANACVATLVLPAFCPVYELCRQLRAMTALQVRTITDAIPKETQPCEIIGICAKKTLSNPRQT
eukprot:5983389-Amphidinium_carterae.3